MAVPVTFSAPGTDYAPSIEDCLRDGVYLMLMADDVNRRAYSYDPDDAALGVRISVEVEQTDDDGSLTLPQQIIAVGFNSIRWQYETSKGGRKRVALNIGFVEANDSESLEIDVTTPPITVLAKMARVDEILMRGTLFEDGMLTNDAKVIDPYNSPLLVGGTYDPAQLRILNHLAPTLTRGAPRVIRRKPATTEDELYAVIDPVNDIGVIYTTVAVYEINLTDREGQTLGGFVND